MTRSLALPNITILDADPKISPVGYTDFEKVWLNSGLAGEDREIAMIHECSHIWLGHRDRTKHAEKLYGKSFDAHTWNVALDCEIAQHVYTKSQTTRILAGDNPLKGGIVWPMDGVSAEFAEEIYQELLAKGGKQSEQGTPHVKPAPKPSAAQGEPGEDGAPGDADGDASAAQGEPGEDGAPGDADGDASAAQGEPGEDGAPGDADSAAGEPTPMDVQDLRRAVKQIKERFGERLTKPVTRKAKLSSDIAALARTAEKRMRSTSVASRRQLDKSLVLPGYRVAKFTPKLEIFVDRSGSFDQAKTQASLEQVNKLVAKYGSKIKSEIIYFGNSRLAKQDPLRGMGDTPYHLIYDHIKLTRPALCVIITDDDDCAPQALLPVPVRVLCVGSRSSCVARSWPMAADLDSI